MVSINCLKWLVVLTIIITSRDCDGRNLDLFHWFRNWSLKIIGRTSNEPRLLQQAIKDDKIQPLIPQTTDFPCRFIGLDGTKNRKMRSGISNEVLDQDLPQARSSTRPSSVHALRPGDIDIIAAMGDSLTAGNGAAATNILQVGSENRGISWSIGGQGTWREYLTLPNIFKVFNPNLIGYSLSDGYGFHKSAQFNVAEIGAMSQDIVYMAKQLVKRITKDPRVNVKKDWKLVTVMIGPNDFCLDVCYLKNPQNAPERHRQELVEALLILKNNLPRTFVNLVPAPHLQILKDFTGKPPLCELTHLAECPCLFGEPNKHRYGEISDIMRRWQNIDIDLENAPEFNDRDDFAVVVQPFDVNLSFPLKNGVTDFSFLSTDCFHFSQKAYSWTANALWNNMLQPPGEKQRNWNEAFKKFVCPKTEFPYIYTLKNAKGFTNSSNISNSIPR